MLTYIYSHYFLWNTTCFENNICKHVSKFSFYTLLNNYNMFICVDDINRSVLRASLFQCIPSIDNMQLQLQARIIMSHPVTCHGPMKLLSIWSNNLISWLSFIMIECTGYKYVHNKLVTPELSAWSCLEDRSLLIMDSNTDMRD